MKKYVPEDIHRLLSFLNQQLNNLKHWWLLVLVKIIWNHSFRTFANFSEKLTFTPWFNQEIRNVIRKEFRNIINAWSLFGKVINSFRIISFLKDLENRYLVCFLKDNVKLKCKSRMTLKKRSRCEKAMLVGPYTYRLIWYQLIEMTLHDKNVITKSLL